MARVHSKALGGLIMVVGLMSGVALDAAPAASKSGSVRTSSRSVGGTDVTFAISESVDGGILLTATTPVLVFRKVVYPDGRFSAQIGEGAGQVAIQGTRDGFSITHGNRSASYRPGIDGEEPRRVMRRLLVDLPAVGHFRRFATELEGIGHDVPEILGIRLTAALLGLADGDEGAARRLGREMIPHFTVHFRKAQSPQYPTPSNPGNYPAPCWDAYVGQVLRAWYEYENCRTNFSLWNPMQGMCVYMWVFQVEIAWAVLLSCAGLGVR